MSKYIFQIAYFNAFEKNLPDSVDLERMMASENFKKALVVLQDTNYAEFASQDPPLPFEEILEKEEQDFRKTLARIGLPEEIIEFLFLRSDLFNLGLALKQEIFGLEFSPEKDFSKASFLKVSALKNKYSFLAEKIKEAKPQSPIELDEKLNEVYFNKAIKRLKKFKEKELKKFFIDYKKTLEKKDGSNMEKTLLKLENDFLERNKWKTQGLDPVFSFFLKKKMAQKKITTILSGKQIGLETNKINRSIENLAALI